METVQVLLALAAVVGATLFLRARSSSKKATKAPKGVDEIMAAADPEQVKMMEEEVILLDERDNVLGHGSKKDTHLNVNIDKGVLHRAFSVFMFNSKGELLLQKRAAEKITFPSYWANTCCSHPLYRPEELQDKDALGVKRAAVRKLEQELGVRPEDVPLDCFRFLTRVHYKARSDEIWGEHEIDYILVCTPPRDPVIRPNSNEVAETRWFRPTELRAWVDASEARGDLVSPWFRIIERTLLHKWWAAVEEGGDALAAHVDEATIHRAGDFDKLGASGPAGAPASAASAAAATATATDATSDAAKKQGAYGKVKTHSEGLLAQLSHLDEVAAMLAYKFGKDGRPAELSEDADEDERFCEEILTKVSRSFAAVIKNLPADLRTSTCIFYLALRGLDTVEDDMEAFKDDLPRKVAELRKFHLHLREPEWSMDGVGQADEARLLREFGHVVRVFMRLPESHQAVIMDITERMAGGMARFIDRDLRQGTTDAGDYDLYCHYVAGLVGEGLSALFAASGHEDEAIAEAKKLSNDMGLFLQKTNIIRDYLEDFVDGRAFWPKTTWGRYAEDLGAFAHGANRAQGLACLNDMVTNALGHAPACLAYMEQLRDPKVFAFCAVPQVMAISTLSKCYANADVFTGVVKIRKGLAVRLMREAKDMPALYRIFLSYARDIRARVQASDPNAEATLAACARLEDVCLANLPAGAANYDTIVRINYAMVAAFVVLAWFLNGRMHMWDGFMPRFTDSLDVAAVAGMAAILLYLLAFCGVPFSSGLVNDKGTGMRRSPSTEALAGRAGAGEEAW